MYDFLVYLMGAFYIIAGLNHFFRPKFYIKMIKDFLPYPQEMVYFSGVVEIILGFGLLFEFSRTFAAYGIILLLIAIFPANLNMLKNAEKWNISPFLLYLRLPLQGLLIYLAWLLT